MKHINHNAMSESLYVIKIGGNVIDNTEACSRFLAAFAKLPGMKILVHGAGKVATQIAAKLQIETQMVDGRRITDKPMLDVVTMVYGGLVNKNLVAGLQSLGCNAIGLTGADGGIIRSIKRPVKTIDYGWVGDINIADLHTDNLILFLQNGLRPVFAPLTHDNQGHMLNTNADTIASTVAVALSALYDVRLVYCFEKKGVLENVEDENSVINLINKEKYAVLKKDNKLFAGILPKIDTAFAAIDAGVKEVLIGDAKDLTHNTTKTTKGTLITK